MKNLYFILMLLVGITSLQAQHYYPNMPTAGLQINIAGGQRYLMLLNGREYPLQSRYFEINPLQSGRYPIQIGYYSGRYPYQRFIVTYNGFADLRPGFILRARINAAGHFNTWDYQPMAIAPVCPPAPVYPYTGHQCPTPQHNGSGTQTPPIIPYPGGGSHYSTTWMSQDVFSQWSDAISRRSFDNDKLLVAKQGLNNVWISAAQIREIMRLFSFESNRLEFAKFAWDYCGDKQQYYLVNDAFTFSGSVRDLDAYISARR